MKVLGNYFFKEQRRRCLASDEKRYTLKAVAERVGVSESYLSRLERQVNGIRPKRETLLRLIDDLKADKAIGLAIFGYIDDDLVDIITRDNRIMGQLIDVAHRLEQIPELSNILDTAVKLNRASVNDFNKLLKDE